MGDPPWLCPAPRHNSYPVSPTRRQGWPPWPCYYTSRYNSHPASLTRRQGWRTYDVFFRLGPRRGARSRPAPSRRRQGWRSDAWCIRLGPRLAACAGPYGCLTPAEKTKTGDSPWPCSPALRHYTHPALLTRRQGRRSDAPFPWLGPRRGAWPHPAFLMSEPWFQKRRTRRLFGPGYSSDDAGDGPSVGR